MSSTIRLAIIGVLAALVFLGGWFLLSRPVEQQGPTVMVIGGDPRMKLCSDPRGVPYATPELVAQLDVGGPLAVRPGHTAEYRFTVFRPTGEPSVSARFWTRASGPSQGEVRSVVGGAPDGPRTDRFDVEFQPAATIVNALEDARIWGSPVPIPVPRPISGPATAVIEIRSAETVRCITSRFDDERIRPLLDTVNRQLVGYLRTTSLEPIVAPPQTMFDQPPPGGSR